MRFDHQRFFASYRSSFGKLDQEQVVGLSTLLRYVELDAEVKDIRWAAYMLATVKHECADTFQPIVESGPRSYFDKYEPGTKIGKSLGNTVPGDGYLYRGRGYVQITGRANYQRMSVRLSLCGLDDLVLHPEAALRPNVAYRIMSLGMRAGSFTGKGLADYIAGKKCDYRGARRVINGLDKCDLIASYAVNFEAMLKGSLTA